MADNNSVNVSINVTDNGSVDVVNKKVKSLKDLLDKSTTSANALSQAVAGISAPNLNVKSTKTTQTAAAVPSTNTAIEKGTAGSKKIASAAMPLAVSIADDGSFDAVSKKIKGLTDLLDRSALSAKNLTQALAAVKTPNLETVKTKVAPTETVKAKVAPTETVMEKKSVIVTVADEGSFDLVSKKIKGLKDFLDSSVVSAKNLTQALAAVKTPNLETVKAKVAPIETVKATQPINAAQIPSANSTFSSPNLMRATPVVTRTQTSETQPQNINQEYAAQRAVAGATGASARNFAAESQGLGGLVRLYATVAANTYAAAAAFTALSKAMDTANMAKGLDQLGAASGKNLSGLAKQLVTVTDNAINMRDAMQSVAQATSADISNKQLLQLSEVAAKASQALGISMPDALSRITRGVAKLEPELLDELGIFIKLDEANKKYAASIGKTVSSLSDFEKRQAFANGVAQEGISKFSQIELSANPFSKLLASVQNLTQSGLEVIAKVLTPIVEALSKSPTALITVLGAIGVTLLKSAIPALTTWRSNLSKVAGEAATNAKKIKDAYEDFDIGSKIKKGMQEAEAATTRAATHVENVRAALAKTAPRSKALGSITAEGDSYDAAANQARVDSLVKSSSNTLTKLAKERVQLVKYAGETELKLIDEKIAKETEILKIRRQAAEENKAAAREQAAAAKGPSAAEAAAAKQTAQGYMLQENARRAEERAIKTGILASAQDNVAKLGTGGAFKRLFDEIKNGRGEFDELGTRMKTISAGLTGLPALLTKATGSFVILGGAIATTLEFLQPYLILLPLVAAAWSYFDSEMSIAKKQQEAFDNATQATDSSLKAVANTLDHLGKNSKTAFSLQSIQATTNALDGLVVSLKDQITAYKDLLMAQSGYERAWDSFWTKFGRGNINTLISSISQDIPKALDTLFNSVDKNKITDKLAGILKLKPEQLNTQDIKKALTNLNTQDPQAARIAIDELAKSLDSVNEANKRSTGALADFHNALKEVDKAADDLHNKLQFTDVFGIIGTKLVGASFSLAEALKDPIKGIEALNSLMQDQKFLSLLPNDTVVSLNARATRIKELNTLMAEANANLLSAKKTTEAEKNKLYVPKNEYEKPNLLSMYSNAVYKPRVAAAEDRQKTAQQLFDDTKKAVQSERLVADDAVRAIYKAGMENLGVSLKNAIQEGAIAAAKSYLSITAAAGGSTAKEEYNLTLAQLESQRNLIEANYTSARNLAINSQAVEKANALKTIEINQARIKASEDFKATKEQPINPYLANLDVYKTEITQAEKIIKRIDDAVGLRTGTLKAGSENNRFPSAADASGSVNVVSGTALQDAVRENQAFTVADIQRKSALSRIEAETVAARVKFILDQISQDEKRAIKAEDDAISTSKAKLASVKLIEELSGVYSKELAVEKSKLEIEILDAAHKKEEVIFNARQRIINAMPVGTKAQRDEQTALQGSLTQNRQDESKIYSITKIGKVREADNKAFLESQKEQTRLNDIALKTEQERNTLSAARLNNQAAMLSNMQALGLMDEKTYSILKARNELEQLENSYKLQQLPITQQLNALEKEKQNNTKFDLENVNLRNSLDAIGIEQWDKAMAIRDRQLQDKIDLTRNTYDINVQLNDIQKEAINLTKEQNIELEKRNKLLEDQKRQMEGVTAIADSLSAVFGDVGKKFGDGLMGVVKAIQDADIKKRELDTKRSSDALAIETDLAERLKSIRSDALLDPEQQTGMIAQAQEEANDKKLASDKDYAKNSAKLDRDKSIKELSSLKSMFKEKTTAYKALDAIEKIQHIRRLYEDGKELVSTLMTEGKKLYAKIFTSEAGVTAKAAAAAQEMAINEGLMLETTATATPGIFAKFSEQLGMFGWPAAAAVVAAIVAMGGAGGGGGYSGPSEADLAKASGTGMEYNSDNKLVAREGGVVGDPTAKAESLKKSMDLLGEKFFDAIDSDSSNLIKYLKAIDDNTKGLAKAMLEQAGFFTGGDILGIKEGTDGGGLLGAIFGKTTTTIDRAGLYVQGTLDQLTSLTEGINGAVAEIYANVTVEDSGLFGTGLFGSSTSYRTAQDLGAAGREALEGIFKNWKSALLLTAKSLEGGSDRVEAALKSVGKITLDVVRGEMSATEYATAVMNELSVKMNQATLATMPYIKAFTQIGEEYYEAANRLTKEAATISQGMRMLGKEGISAIGDISGALHKIEVSTAFLDKFEGDLSKGAEAIQFYFDTFQTETQKNAYYATQLADGFKEIGYTTTLTLDQYKAAIAALNINDPGQAAQLANLLKLAPAYDKVNQAQQKTVALQADLMEAEGDTAGALALRRKEEYAALSDVDAALQRRIDALGDEKAAYDKLRTALSDTVDGIKTSVKSLRDFSTSILTGPNSLMSPGEKLAILQGSFDKAILAAQGPRDTAEGRKLADQAAQDVVKYGQQLVDSATTMFASGPESQRIINQVASSTTGVADKLALAQTDAEKQLTQLEASSGYLKSIDETNQKLLKEYEAAHAAAVATDPNTPQKTIGPVIKNATEAPGTAVSDMVAAQQTQLAAQKETNRLLQETIDTQKALLISNAKVIQAQTDALNTAAEDRRLAEEYAERNKPTEYVGA